METDRKRARGMLRILKGGSDANPARSCKPRFSSLFARDASATEMLQGCPVVTAAGEWIGAVRSILIDTRSRRLRYVMLLSRPGNALIAIPWHALYFDSALSRLVYFTCV
ncbi:PRC-barrel domain-containing protein [Noviherbaspirillum pedocola]|uniref:PRC-barrel domain-containing protein n=1 Tax=Noviherbaspirillum pedocola TaxID=2801341 RepID=A0A934T231_9BURK|nr:PRC-barrel domain-containing protein [Noviherbaspirillum pedocola]MBK4736343.1 PRC-barrel domain-containing protein [Noviherbaspirillum pedocola]